MDNDPTEATEATDAAVPDASAPAKRASKKEHAPRKKVSAKAARRPAVEKKVENARSKLVVLLRHGAAEEPKPDRTDGERSLTTEGHDRTKRAGKGLSKLVSKVDALYSSPLLRALQTALWVAKAYGGKIKVQTTGALEPPVTPAEVRRLIAETDGSTIVLVGHEPGLTACAADLLGIDDLRTNLKRAGCIGVRIDDEGRGTLEWMLAPRALRSL